MHHTHWIASEFCKCCFNCSSIGEHYRRQPLLPHRCQDIFESVVDFMYGQEITTETDNLAPLLKVPHTLQHHELQHKVEQMRALNELIAALAICKSVFRCLRGHGVGVDPTTDQEPYCPMLSKRVSARICDPRVFRSSRSRSMAMRL